jgi:hypothetical protein
MADELMAALDVMAYGYKVTVKVNGVDLGFEGGKSESKRLFGADDPMVEQLPPEMKNLACLKSGKNQIEVDYKRTEEDSTGLTVELRSAEQSGTTECTFRLREEPDAAEASKSVKDSFDL